MPYRDKEDSNRASRMYKRKARHGNWRQVYVNCWGMCQNRLQDGSICGSTDNLDFHDVFGEKNSGPSETNRLVLLCLPCHNKQHGFGLTGMLNRPCSSKLTEDVNWEIQKHGGVDAWMKYFGLVESGDLEEALETLRMCLEPGDKRKE